MKLIERDYLQKIINVMGTPDIKVITGIRRCGKSKLLEQFKKYVEDNIKNSNIVYIDFNLMKNANLKDYNKLYDYISNNYDKNKLNFVMIDEVQLCDGFEHVINSLHAEEKYDIYITGSNAFLLSSDLATLFTGRTFQIEVFPFSFKEYKRYFNLEDNDKAFDSYVLDGGMAGSYLYKTEEEKKSYLKDVYETLIVRDIFKRHGVKDDKLMSSLSDFLMDNISNKSSLRNITNSLNIETNHKTIGNYIEYLCEAYAFYKVGRYDIKGKKYLNSEDKYYLADHSFRFARLGTRNLDYGRVYENIVAIELKRRGYEIYAGTLYNKEVDFIATKGEEKIYIQVSDNIEDEKTFARETSSLLQINDAYPKIIIARTKHDTYQYEGIKIYDIAEFLSN